MNLDPKNLLLPTLLLLPMLAFGQTQTGNFYKGNKLYEWSREAKDPTAAALLNGYIAGVHDSRWHLNEFCIPGGSSGVQLGQLRDVVVKYLADNPASRHEDGDVLVSSALKQAWPCLPR